jgi:hypothetical protein
MAGAVRWRDPASQLRPLWFARCEAYLCHIGAKYSFLCPRTLLNHRFKVFSFAM